MKAPRIVLAPALFALLACGSVATSPSPAPSEARAPTGPVVAAPGWGKSIGRLRTRDHDLVIFASATGTRVTVLTKDGAVLAERVDAEALRATHPELHAIVRSAIAADGAYLDATLDHRPAPARSSNRDGE